MSIKKKLGLGVASAAIGLSLLGGGTYAFFNDTATQASSFASGTLDLNVNPTTLVDLGNLKPGDWTNKTFKLTNNGSLDIKKVKLHTSYTVTKLDGSPVAPATAQRYADAIKVQFLDNTGDTGTFLGLFDDHAHNVITSKTISQLVAMTPEDLAQELDRANFSPPTYVLRDGIKAGSGKEATDDFKVQFQFVNDTVNTQNDLQGLKLNLSWQFEGIQEDGEQR
jgi:spore coat-associated protein N